MDSQGANLSYGPVRRPTMDLPGPAKPPENRKLRTPGFTGRAASRTARKYSNATDPERFIGLRPIADLLQRPRTTSASRVRIEGRGKSS